MQVKFNNNIKQYLYIKNNQPHLTKGRAWLGYTEQQEGGKAHLPAMCPHPDMTDSFTKCQNNDIKTGDHYGQTSEPCSSQILWPWYTV
jgi:hypothetical protein